MSTLDTATTLAEAQAVIRRMEAAHDNTRKLWEREKAENKALAERIRRMNNDYLESCHDQAVKYEAQLAEKDAEIERLNASVDCLHEQEDSQMQKADKYHAEIERIKTMVRHERTAREDALTAEITTLKQQARELQLRNMELNIELQVVQTKGVYEYGYDMGGKAYEKKVAALKEQLAEASTLLNELCDDGTDIGWIDRILAWKNRQQPND